jgi:uncharacterized protein (DUF1786 family)
VRLLAIDIGTGTQDVLLWESGVAVENLVQMVMPSPTVLVERRVRAATRQRLPLFLTGVTMGGGPCAWAIMDHVRAGLPVFATPDAARTLDDDLERVRADGIAVVADTSEAPREAQRVEMRDLDLDALSAALRAFDTDPHVDALLVAAFDHGAAPPGYSDRAFRFDYLAHSIGVTGELAALSYLRDDLPPTLTRLAAIASCVPDDLPLLLMDTGAAAALGALDDPRVRAARYPLLVNVGNFHTLAFQMVPVETAGRASGRARQTGAQVVSASTPAYEHSDARRSHNGAQAVRVSGLFEHHTGELKPGQLDTLLDRLANGTLTNQEVFDSQGHGALLRCRTAVAPDLCAVTGPRRALMASSHWRPYYAVPHGDMMLAGCFGLLRAAAARVPEWREEIEASLR